MRTVKNPIIPGFYPDPSICKADDGYYLACSSFEMYPGIPIFFSKNLVDWEQIGYAMTKENGFHVRANTMTGGVMAPTIRYHNGTFYIINANFQDKGNFIVKTNDPRQGWSDPIWLDDIPGIDASLFFDEDDQAYIVGTGNVVPNGDQMEPGIYVCKYDIEKMKVIGEAVPIWDSALRHAWSPEAPHMYKIGDYYYLMISEGGTEQNHAVTVARSKDIFSWFDGNPANPVLTNRNLGYNDVKLTNIGHADLIQGEHDEWYAVFLGSRTVDGFYKNLGRETFICPVEWQHGWPFFTPKTGRVEKEYQIPTDKFSLSTLHLTTNQVFDGTTLPLEFITWGTPYGRVYQNEADGLKLFCNKAMITPKLYWALDHEQNSSRETGISFVGRRQTSIDFQAEAKFSFTPRLENESAGFVIMQASNHQYRVEKRLLDGEMVLRLILTTTTTNTYPHMPGFKAVSNDKVLYQTKVSDEELVLGLKAIGQHYQFYVKDNTGIHELGDAQDGRLINPEEVGCMSGTIMGMFATGNGQNTDNTAIFKQFEYLPLN